MIILRERNLQITIEGEVKAWNFDSETHGLTHCMKAVDFVVEFPSHYLFIELKDPQHPDAPQDERERFIQEFRGAGLDEELKYKCRDSFLYEWAAGRADKPVHFFVLVADETLTAAELTSRTDELARKLPVEGPTSGAWTKRIVESCVVFNVESWNRLLSQFPIDRLES